MPSIGTVSRTLAHGLDGGAVGAVLVAPAHPPGGGQGGRLGDPDELESEVAVGRLTAHGAELTVRPLGPTGRRISGGPCREAMSGGPSQKARPAARGADGERRADPGGSARRSASARSVCSAVSASLSVGFTPQPAVVGKALEVTLTIVDEPLPRWWDGCRSLLVSLVRSAHAGATKQVGMGGVEGVGEGR